LKFSETHREGETMLCLVYIAALVAAVIAQENSQPQEAASSQAANWNQAPNWNQAAVNKLSYGNPVVYQSFPLYHPPSSPYYYQTYNSQPQYYYYPPGGADSNKKYVQLGYPYYPSYYYFPSSPPPEGQTTPSSLPEEPADGSTTPKPDPDLVKDHTGAPGTPVVPVYQPFKTFPVFPYYYLPSGKPSSESSPSVQSSASAPQPNYGFLNPFNTAQYDSNKQFADYPYKLNYAPAYPSYYYKPASTFGYHYTYPLSETNPAAATNIQNSESNDNQDPDYRSPSN
jgi:hypothetical protein